MNWRGIDALVAPTTTIDARDHGNAERNHYVNNENLIVALPTGAQSGEDGVWTLPTTRVEDNGDVVEATIEIDALFLGIGSSRTDRHWPHVDRYALPSERCGLCRWFETRIFKLDENDYVLHHAGRTIVPDESQLCRHQHAYSPEEVIEFYRVRKTNDDGSQRIFLPRPAIKAFAQAVPFDEDLREALENDTVLS